MVAEGRSGSGGGMAREAAEGRLDAGGGMADQYVVHGIIKGLLAFLLLGMSMAFGQQPESEAALRAGAVAATKTLGKETVRGNFSYTIQRMYPRWKKKTAADLGGMDKLVEKEAAGKVRQAPADPLKAVGLPTGVKIQLPLFR